MAPSSDNPRARLIAIRAACGDATWERFYARTGLDDATARRWLSGMTVRAAFVEAFANALGIPRSALCIIRDEIVNAERGGAVL